MRRTGALLHVALVASTVLTVIGLQQWGWDAIERAEESTSDFLAVPGRKSAAHSALVFLAIDDASVSLDAETDLQQLYDLEQADPDSRRALQLMAEGFPWSREVYGLVLERLVKSGARAVVFDLTFPKESANDDKFKQRLDLYSDSVVVAGNFVSDAALGPHTATLTFSAPAHTLIPHATPHDRRIGFANFFPEIDLVTRAAKYWLTFEHVADQVSPADAERLYSLSARAAIAAGYSALLPRELESRRLRFAGPAGHFPARSIFQIFVPEYWSANYGSGEFFRDKIVIIGASGNWQQDEHLTPFGIMPGAEIHLNALNALLGGEFIRELPAAGRSLIVAAGGALALLLWFSVPRPMPRCVALCALAIGIVASAAVLWDCGILVPLVTPLIAFTVSGVTGLISDIAGERREKARVRHALERYVSRNVIREMMDAPAAYEATLGGVVKPVTILFTDIRNFTKVSANADPHVLVTQLNEYLTSMVDCVFRFGGTLDKFIGDAVMAVWGNARSDGEAADGRNAIACAIAMRDELGRLNKRWAAEGRTQLEIGMALNHGEVIVGHIGSPHRMEFTVIGDAVNVTWRLQERTKVHGCEVLIGESLAELINPEFATELLDSIRVGDTITANYFRLIAEGPSVRLPVLCSSSSVRKMSLFPPSGGGSKPDTNGECENVTRL